MNTGLLLANLILQSDNDSVDRMLGTIFGAQLAPVFEGSEIKGFRLTEVTLGGTADTMGLRANDIILTVFDCPVGKLDVSSSILRICTARQDGSMELEAIRPVIKSNMLIS